jgi:hypothetical protein
MLSPGAFFLIFAGLMLLKEGREPMRVTVCKLPDQRKALASAWEALISYVKTQRSNLVLLPELPFAT